MSDLLMDRFAVLSDDERYRYQLLREWGDGPTVAWIMLNPSTADAYEDDATIRKVVGFSKRWGYEAVHVVNLFALRSTDPKALVGDDDPVGPQNDLWLAGAMFAPLVVVAWGSTGDYATRYFRRQRVRELAEKMNRPLHCLGVTKSGDPRHPLYVKYETPLVEWSLRTVMEKQ
jgi:hypothetical protein